MTTDQEKIAEFLAGRKIAKGIGDEESPCTVAAINLALSGVLTDARPPCMSKVLHAFVIPIQDAMPDELCNSEQYRRLVPLMAGTADDGRDEERVRRIMDWMWGVVLPQVQPVADAHGFGDEWRRMCDERTAEAAVTAWEAGRDFGRLRRDAHFAAFAAHAAWTVWAEAVEAAASAAELASEAFEDNGARDNFWAAADPVSLIETLV